jgi:catechol 2,3-dioxygenase-like lactoylglutathione lyase family enzyme
MIIRFARHTSDLQRVEDFYTAIVGLQKLGEFRNHDGYDGIFLGLPNLDWHLEFTTSNETPISTFDEDDALVFYLNTEDELRAMKHKLQSLQMKLEQPKNPYWTKNGTMISDPDGYKIIFTIKLK